MIPIVKGDICVFGDNDCVVLKRTQFGKKDTMVPGTLVIARTNIGTATISIPKYVIEVLKAELLKSSYRLNKGIVESPWMAWNAQKISKQQAAMILCSVFEQLDRGLAPSS